MHPENFGNQSAKQSSMADMSPGENPEGELPGLKQHNARVLNDRASVLVDSILRRSPSDDELSGKA